MGLLALIPPAKLPSGMNLTGSTVVDAGVWLACFAYVLGMIAFIAYLVRQVLSGRGHKG